MFDYEGFMVQRQTHIPTLRQQEHSQYVTKNMFGLTMCLQEFNALRTDILSLHGKAGLRPLAKNKRKQNADRDTVACRD